MTSVEHPQPIRHIASTRMPTRWGTFQTLAFERPTPGASGTVETALAMIMGDVARGAPLLRIHSQCFTSEVFGSLRCDCSEQLEIAMQMIAGEGCGLVIYEHQEGRGIGLMAKLQAYSLQDLGLDTIEANEALGFSADYRTFDLPAAILTELGINQVRLLSNNPQKSRALAAAGIEVAAQIPCEAAANPHSFGYLRAKREKMGHTLSIGHSVQDEFPFADIETALEELRAGRMIVVVDDEDRENEGDLTVAAEHITPEAINFMAVHGRGLICLAMTAERLDALDLAPMAPYNTALGGTAFTVSIDVKGRGVTTGISAYDRAQTIRAAIAPNSSPDDFGRPGHIFPLRARNGGVLERRGQTEAAVDLARVAGLYPAGVICEIVNDDGTMARVPDLVRFCRKHNLAMVTVADLARYRMDTDEEESLPAPLLCA
ncbi:MAG TPA: 3,4-dihydroxy-2-butanone-4-phosphate synthase [Candidatus Acidoferrum sp.]|nr:3,4-dihydroxy-2-butanone-4-phosphate synthase [Candidatus Acidoferrum sp.]